MTLETERLIIREWRESDAKALYEIARHPDVGPITGWPCHTSVDESRDVIKNVLSNDKDHAVTLKDGTLIGCIGIIPKARVSCAGENEVELGFWLGVPYWGNGYMPETVKRILQYLFTETNCRGVWCGYYDGNEKSRRCQEKCGFIYHHTEEKMLCELMHEYRTAHYQFLSKQTWEEQQLCVPTAE